jgi:hypothetical protein
VTVDDAANVPGGWFHAGRPKLIQFASDEINQFGRCVE